MFNRTVFILLIENIEYLLKYLATIAKCIEFLEKLIPSLVNLRKFSKSFGVQPKQQGINLCM